MWKYEFKNMTTKREGQIEKYLKLHTFNLTIVITACEH